VAGHSVVIIPTQAFMKLFRMPSWFKSESATGLHVAQVSDHNKLLGLFMNILNPVIYKFSKNPEITAKF
jgi:hypothetical protein